MWSASQQAALRTMGFALWRVPRPGQALPLAEADLSAALKAAVQRVAGANFAALTCPPLRGAALKRALWQQLRDLRRAR
jgi:hypothetical protein